MTRINCVPPAELTDKHLGAEYRELPRVFALARAAAARGYDPFSCSRVPTQYTLGPGHVLFFYTRLAWCVDRYRAVVEECSFRGRRIGYPLPPDGWDEGVPASWKQNWQPSEADKALNRARIAARLSTARSRRST